MPQSSVKKDGKITVAIVTARHTSETSFWQWQDLLRRFLRGDASETQLAAKAGPAFIAAAMAAEMLRPLTHLEHQLHALRCQTRPPDVVTIFQRGALYHCLAPVSLGPRLLYPQGCADKNEAFLRCETEYIMLLDDCCIPDPACVELAYDACKAGNFAMLKHHKLYLPTEDRETVEVATANASLKSDRRVAGIFAAPLEYILDLNGYDERLDGQHALWDLEFLRRVDQYTFEKDIPYYYHPNMRVWEIEHDRPWKDIRNTPLTLADIPYDGYRAKGRDLRWLRESR